MAVVVIWHTYTALFTGLILASLGKVIFDPASQAYIGDQVPYQRRGAAVAFVEVSWSGAFLIGMPVVAWLIAHGGWHAPFRWLALAGGLFILVVAFGLPASKAADRPAPLQAGSKRSFLPNRSALGMLAVAYLITTGAQNIFIVFGAWLENAFMVRVAALGIMAAAFGLAELIGEGLVAVLADNLGKRRALSGGLALSALAFFLLPFVGTSRLGAVVGLFSIFVCFEFSLVCAISLMTEMLPHARGTYMSLNVAVLEAAHGTGAVIGLLLFSAGIQANSAISAVLNLLALATLLRWVRPPSADSPNAAQRGQPQP
jgi:predicted MFS family arabinose efflux permease